MRAPRPRGARGGERPLKKPLIFSGLDHPFRNLADGTEAGLRRTPQARWLDRVESARTPRIFPAASQIPLRGRFRPLDRVESKREPLPAQIDQPGRPRPSRRPWGNWLTPLPLLATERSLASPASFAALHRIGRFIKASFSGRWLTPSFGGLQASFAALHRIAVLSFEAAK